MTKSMILMAYGHQSTGESLKNVTCLRESHIWSVVILETMSIHSHIQFNPAVLPFQFIPKSYPITKSIVVTIYTYKTPKT